MDRDGRRRSTSCAISRPRASRAPRTPGHGDDGRAEVEAVAAAAIEEACPPGMSSCRGSAPGSPWPEADRRGEAAEARADHDRGGPWSSVAVVSAVGSMRVSMTGRIAVSSLSYNRRDWLDAGVSVRTSPHGAGSASRGREADHGHLVLFPLPRLARPSLGADPDGAGPPGAATGAGRGIVKLFGAGAARVSRRGPIRR